MSFVQSVISVRIVLFFVKKYKTQIRQGRGNKESFNSVRLNKILLEIMKLSGSSSNSNPQTPHN